MCDLKRRSETGVTATDVGWNLLAIAKRNGAYLTPLQVAKLTFLAYGWWLAFRKDPLFLDRIEAWRHGPVVRSLYDEFKEFKADPVPYDRIEKKIKKHPCEDEVVLRHLKRIFKAYGNWSGISLSHLTHRPGSPWDLVYIEGQNVPIPYDVIREYYLKKRSAQRGEAS